MTHRIMTSFALIMTMAVSSHALAQSGQKPVASDHAPANPAVKSPDTITWGKLGKGRNSFTEGEAKMRLEKAGYNGVDQLKLDKDGLWQARAQLDGQPVHVALDYKGNVAHR